MTEYLQAFEDHLERLAFPNGALISAELGQGNKGVDYILRKPPYTMQSWVDRVQGWLEQMISRNNDKYTYEVHERDEAGIQGIVGPAGAWASATSRQYSVNRPIIF